MGGIVRTQILFDTDRENAGLKWQIVPRADLPPTLYEQIVRLCDEAYGEDFSELMASYEGATHVLGFDAGRLVVHALWVEAEVEVGAGTPMRAAVVEAVATRPDRRHRGLGREAMGRLVAEITSADYDLGVLWAFDSGWYGRLGWERWSGPVGQVVDGVIEPVVGDDVMIHRLPRTPDLDLSLPLLVDDQAGSGRNGPTASASPGRA